MHYEALCLELGKRLAMPLPGGLAHDVFRAMPVGDGRPLFEHADPPRLGGVILLLYEEQGIVKFPLIKRPEYTGHHGGQVSLPGGKAEPGEDAVQTALRECEEEIGVQVSPAYVLGRLSDFFVIPSNVVVTPVVAALPHVPTFTPDSYEVSRIIEARVSDLTAVDSIKQKEILAGGKYRMMAPHFEIENEVVWGATAMMLNEFRVILNSLPS